MTDRNEALRLADELNKAAPWADGHVNHEAAALLRQQAERIAELEATQAGIMQAITDPENQPSQYATVTLDYLSDKLKAWEDKWFKRDQQANTAEAERDQLRAEVERLRVDAKEEEARLIRVCGLLGDSNAERDQLLGKVAALTKPFGESHLVSLIDAAIQGHASTREAMRWFAAQITPKAARTKQDPDQNTIKNFDSVVMVCPKKDIMCGDRPDNWCKACPNQNRIKNGQAIDHARTTHKDEG